MKTNPVFRREWMIRGRSVRFPLIVMIFNGILAAVAMFYMYSIVAQVRITSSIHYSGFLRLYTFVSTLEFFLLMFIMPALTSGSISGERERQTLELLFTTKMSSGQIILGKLFSAFSQMLIIVISSFPVILLTFVYGGLDFFDMGLLMLCFITVAVFTGSMGILFSAVMQKSTLSNVCTYGMLLFVVGGTYLINLFTGNMSRLHLSEAAAEAAGQLAGPASGPSIYLLLWNPMITFFEIIRTQIPGFGRDTSLAAFLGAYPGNFVTDHWICLSILVQLVTAAFLIWAAVRRLDPVKNERD